MIGLFKLSNPVFDFREFLCEEVRNIPLVQIITRDAVSVDRHDTCRHPGRCAVIGQIIQDHAACCHADIVPDQHRPQNGSPGTDQYIVPDRGMAFAGDKWCSCRRFPLFHR